MKNRMKSYLQAQMNFTSYEAERILYGMQGITIELSKLFILLFIAFPFGYADEILITTIVLLSIHIILWLLYIY